VDPVRRRRLWDGEEAETDDGGESIHSALNVEEPEWPPVERIRTTASGITLPSQRTTRGSGGQTLYPET
jgi:hypothetical protein